MIGKAKAISHGINCLRYVMGESDNKKHPEKIYFVKNNLLDTALDAAGIYDRFNFACTAKSAKMKDKVIRIELSPSKKYTKGFTQADWQQLWDDFIREFDNIEVRNQETGKIMSKKTNLANTMGTVWLHRDSRGGIPHLHGAYCRVDEDGNTNNDHRIEVRAQLAAERVALKRGWITARKVHDINVEQAKEACLSVLRSMNQWDWNLYARGLQLKGYGIHFRKDNNGKIVGYLLIKGNSIYHASKLNTRQLTAAHIEDTWRKMHHAASVVERPAVKSNVYPAKVEVPKQMKQDDTPIKPDYSISQENTIPHSIVVNAQEQTLHIPKEVDDYFANSRASEGEPSPEGLELCRAQPRISKRNEFDERTVANSKELCEMAVAIFAQLLLPSVSESSGGGSNTNGSHWRDKDEDDIEWARRCAMFAKSTLGVKPRRRFRR